MTAASLLAVGEARGQDLDPERVATVKAGMMVNFVRYTTWPKEAFADEDAAIVITIVGDGDIDEALAAAARDQLVNGRAIQVQHVRYPTPPEGETAPTPEEIAAFHETLCASHAVYFGRSERNRIDASLEALKDSNVLTVSDIDSFAEKGGMLGLAVRGERIAFDANEEVIKETDLEVSSQVLKLARIVTTAAEDTGGER